MTIFPFQFYAWFPGSDWDSFYDPHQPAFWFAGMNEWKFKKTKKVQNCFSINLILGSIRIEIHYRRKKNAIKIGNVRRFTDSNEVALGQRLPEALHTLFRPRAKRIFWTTRRNSWSWRHTRGRTSHAFRFAWRKPSRTIHVSQFQIHQNRQWNIPERKSWELNSEVMNKAVNSDASTIPVDIRPIGFYPWDNTIWVKTRSKYDKNVVEIRNVDVHFIFCVFFFNGK